MSTIVLFKIIESEHDVCSRVDSMKKFCEFLREQATKVIDFKKKKIKLLTNKQQKLYENARCSSGAAAVQHIAYLI